MAAKFHVNADFEVKKCSASSVERCKFFGIHDNGLNHYDTDAEANQAAQSLMAVMEAKYDRATASKRRAPRTTVPVNTNTVDEVPQSTSSKTVEEPSSQRPIPARPEQAPKITPLQEAPVKVETQEGKAASTPVDIPSSPQKTTQESTQERLSASTDAIDPTAPERFKREAQGILGLLAKKELPPVKSSEEMVSQWFNGSESHYVAMRNIAQSKTMSASSKEASVNLLLSGMSVNVLNRNVEGPDYSVPRHDDVSSVVIDASDDTIDVRALKRGSLMQNPYVRQSS